MYPHRINLRGPWTYIPLAHTVLLPDGRIIEDDRRLPRAGHMTMPCRWADAGLPAFAGRVRFRRQFQWLQPLAYYERLWLVVGAADYFASVLLNGQHLGCHTGAFEPFEFDITSVVQARNELVIEVDCPAEAESAGSTQIIRGGLGRGGGLWGTVGLEVRRETFLRRVEVQADWNGSRGLLHVGVKVMGEALKGLHVDVRLDGRSLAFQPVVADFDGKLFSAALEVADVVAWSPAEHGEPRLYEVAVELVDTATSLDVRALRTGFRNVAWADGWLVNGKPVAQSRPWPLQEPVVEAVTLDRADESGELLNLEVGPVAAAENVARIDRVLRSYLGHHPCLVVTPVAATKKETG